MKQSVIRITSGLILNSAALLRGCLLGSILYYSTEP